VWDPIRKGSPLFDMSSRRPQKIANTEASHLRAQLETLKQQSMAVEANPTSEVQSEVPAFDKLSGTEQAAGSLGVHVEAWKPIKYTPQNS